MRGKNILIELLTSYRPRVQVCIAQVGIVAITAICSYDSENLLRSLFLAKAVFSGYSYSSGHYYCACQDH